MEQLPKSTMAELQTTVANGQTILFWTADWCPDCRFIKPAMPEIEAEYADFKFIQVDRDENIDLALKWGSWGFQALWPTVMVKKLVGLSTRIVRLRKKLKLLSITYQNKD